MGYFIRLLILTAVAACVLGVLLLLFKLAFIVAISIALVLAAVAALGWLSTKRLRSTSRTRPPSIT